jgi:hypothetical protein
VTTPPQEPGDAAAQPSSGAPSLPAYPVQPGWGYQPPPPSGGKKTALIAGIVGLVAGIGIGVAGYAIASSDSPATDSGSPGGRTSASAPAIVTTTTTTASTEVEGHYSMSSVTNACDLIDPSPMTKWSSTPDGPAKHYETPPVSLRCDVPYTTKSTVDPYNYNQSGITFEAEFTQSGTDLAYDQWQERDRATTKACGVVTGIGERGYWCRDQADTSNTRVSYLVAVQDSNVSVSVRLAISLAEGEPPVDWNELDSIAKSEVQRALAGLRT